MCRYRRLRGDVPSTVLNDRPVCFPFSLPAAASFPAYSPYPASTALSAQARSRLPNTRFRIAFNNASHDHNAYILHGMDTSKRKYMNIATTPLARLDEANLSIRIGRPYTTISARLINNLSISSPCLQCPKRHGQTSTVHTPFSSHPVCPVHTTPSQQSISMLTPTKPLTG